VSLWLHGSHGYMVSPGTHRELARSPLKYRVNSVASKTCARRTLLATGAPTGQEAH